MVGTTAQELYFHESFKVIFFLTFFSSCSILHPSKYSLPVENALLFKSAIINSFIFPINHSSPLKSKNLSRHFTAMIANLVEVKN